MRKWFMALDPTPARSDGVPCDSGQVSDYYRANVGPTRTESPVSGPLSHPEGETRMTVGRYARTRRLAAVLIASGLVVAACGGDDDDAGDGPTGATAPDTAEPTD